MSSFPTLIQTPVGQEMCLFCSLQQHGIIPSTYEVLRKHLLLDVYKSWKCLSAESGQPLLVA